MGEMSNTTFILITITSILSAFCVLLFIASCRDNMINPTYIGWRYFTLKRIIVLVIFILIAILFFGLTCKSIDNDIAKDADKMRAIQELYFN